MPASGQILTASTEILNNKLNNRNLNFTTMTELTIKEKMEKLLTDETFNPEPCNIRLFATNVARFICEEMTVEKRVCGSEFPGCSIKNPCDGHEGYNCAAKVTEEKAQEILKAIERLKFLENGYKTTYSMTTLEQFNEEVMKEFKEEFGEMIEAVRVETGVHYLIPDWITKKLTEHKELILKMVREKIFEDTNYDYKLWIESEKYRWHQGGRKELREEFLNNLDTI